MLNTTHLFRLTLLAGVLATGSACERKEVQVYIAPKDRAVEEKAPEAEAAHNHGDAWQPQLTWTLPAGWEEMGPDRANLARFSAGGAQVAVTALASMAGQDAVLVNMYRQIRNESPLEDAEALKQLKDATIAGTPGKLLEVSDTQEGKSQRFMVAFLHRSEGSLFFKIQGDDGAVSGQKEAFLEFLKSVKFGKVTASAPAHAHAPEPAAAPKPTAADKPPTPSTPTAPAAGTLPEGWKPLEPGPMQAAKFSVPNVGDAKAEIAVSVFPSDTGGTLSNVQRWRGQLSLPAVDDATALQSAKPLAGGPEGALLIELVNGPRALTGAIVPRDGKWYFFKLLGDTAAVTAAHDAFVGFAATKP